MSRSCPRLHPSTGNRIHFERDCSMSPPSARTVPRGEGAGKLMGRNRLRSKGSLSIPPDTGDSSRSSLESRSTTLRWGNHRRALALPPPKCRLSFCFHLFRRWPRRSQQRTVEDRSRITFFSTSKVTISHRSMVSTENGSADTAAGRAGDIVGSPNVVVGHLEGAARA